MATDSYVQIRPDSTGKKIDTVQLSIGGNTVERERVESVRNVAANTYGADASVAPAATATLVTYAAPANWRFLGILGGGEVDGLFAVKFDGTTKYAIRTNIAQRQACFILPNPDAAGASTTVTVAVTNTGEATGIYEVTLLGDLED